jgi:hypothetical protein
MSVAGTIGLPVSFARCCATFTSYPFQQLDFTFQTRGERVELLPHRHGDGILRFRATHLHNVQVGIPFLPERGDELFQLLDQLVVPEQERDLDGCRVRVVRRLRHIQVIVRLDDRVLAFLVSGQLEGDIGQDLVGVHVGGCARPALVPVHDKLIVVLPVQHGLAGLLDRIERFLLHGADVRIRPGGRQLHYCPGFDETRIVVDQNARELEVLEGAHGLDAVILVRRDLLLPEEVLLSAKGLLCHCIRHQPRKGRDHKDRENASAAHGCTLPIWWVRAERLRESGRQLWTPRSSRVRAA